MSGEAEGDARTPVIDVHSHILPGGVVDVVRHGRGPDGMRIERDGETEWMVHRQGFRYPLSAALSSSEGKLGEMDELGIDIAVLSAAPTLFLYWLDASEYADLSRHINEELLAMARGSDGRLVPVANLPMQDPKLARDELEWAHRQGMGGAMIGPHVDGQPLDHDQYDEVLRVADRLGFPLVLHPYYVGARTGLEDYYLTNVVGNPLDTTVAAARLMLSGALDRNAQLRFLLLHGGGFLPYQIGRLDRAHQVREESRCCAVAPSGYLRRFFYDTLTHDPDALAFLIGQVGSDRVAYGTDAPFDMGGGSLVEQLGEIGLDATAEERVRGDNAKTLFSLRVGEEAAW